MNNIYNIAAFVLQYYISTHLSGEIEKKSAIRNNPNDTVRRETENPEWILETVVSHYMLFIGPRQISGTAGFVSRAKRINRLYPGYDAVGTIILNSAVSGLPSPVRRQGRGAKPGLARKDGV